MSVGLYMDEHVPRAITEGLRLRGVDVLTAQEDNRRCASDSELLDRATELGRILQDSDLLREATRRQRTGEILHRRRLRPSAKGDDRRMY
jgi:predicted nuclease of predicted toxin-antitoxin system